jgi:hypothetical protein
MEEDQGGNMTQGQGKETSGMTEVQIDPNGEGRVDLANGKP